MATELICGFESGSLLAEPWKNTSVAANPAAVGNATIETTTVRTGTYSLKVNPASGANGYWTAAAATTQPNTTIYQRVYVRVTSRPASTARLLIGRAGTNHLNVLLNANGTLSLRTNVTVQGTSSTALTDTTRWYCVELKGIANVQELRIDGVVEASGANASSVLGYEFGALDTVADTYTAYFDDLRRDSAAYPGPGQCLLLLPVSDNNRGGWTAGNGGTANVYLGVVNRPPVGVASASETNTSNIESATNSATDNCDLNCQSYASAGIAAIDTINAVTGYCAHGEDIATGTKAGAVTIVSNPAQAVETGFTFGDDINAHGAFLGSWVVGVQSSTNWTYIDSPSVTLATQPVLRLGKRTATTRVVCVCFAGIYVDYTTGVASTLPAGTLGLLGVGR